MSQNLTQNSGDPDRTDSLDQTSNMCDKRSSEFTSELYKLEISNLPKNLNKFHMAKNLVEHYLKLENHRKIKLGKTKVYVTFPTAQDRDNAIAKINNSKFKDRILEATVAEPKDDPFIKSRRLFNYHEGDKSDSDKLNEHLDEKNSNDINKQVCPLYDREYDVQIKIKTREMRNVLTLYRNITRLCPNLKRDAPKLYDWNEGNKAISCHFEGVQWSPRINGYRNKCEFNVDSDGNCGFRIGRYKDGSSKVVHPPTDCPLLNSKMFEILDVFEKHMKDKSKTKLVGFDPVTHMGNIRQLTIRTNELEESLIILDMAKDELSDSDIEQEIESIRTLLSSIEGVISIYSNITDKAHLTCMDETLKLIHGVPHLTEYMNVQPDRQLTFRIGPQSFFQINTKAAEILYKSIGDIAELNDKSIVLDIGCGIGTISLSLADRVNHVIGVEVVEAAVEDAKFNAKANGIKNVEFFAGKAEDLIGVTIDIAKKIMYDELKNEGDIVAIVDPPRAGFNSSFIKSLRASNIKKIVYVACEPKHNQNLLCLCRPRSKAYQGEPFVPTKAKAIDLFPHTKSCELVVLYQRLDQVLGSA